MPKLNVPSPPPHPVPLTWASRAGCFYPLLAPGGRAAGPCMAALVGGGSVPGRVGRWAGERRIQAGGGRLNVNPLLSRPAVLLFPSAERGVVLREDDL